jgi:hypothetical protein
MSRVGLIAAYDRAMLAALAMPTATPTEIAARNAAIAAARQDQRARVGRHLPSPCILLIAIVCGA